MIILDSRESVSNSKLKKSLERLDTDFKIEQLSVGDILIGRYIIERKSTQDLLTRNKDGSLHIFQQIERLIEKRNEGLIPILLVEGLFFDAWKYRPVTKMSIIQAQLFGLLNSIQLFKYYIPVVKVDSHAQLMIWIKNLIKRAKDPSQAQLRTLRTHPRRELSMNDQALYQLQGHKGIGVNRSKKALKSFGNIINIYTIANHTDMLVLEKIIGKNYTKHLFDVIYHEYKEGEK